MTKTETLYITKSHAYPSRKVTCENPATCTDPKHWTANDTELESLEEARAEAGMDDAQAVRIVKVTRTIVEEEAEVETIDQAWTAEEIAGVL